VKDAGARGAARVVRRIACCSGVGSKVAIDGVRVTTGRLLRRTAPRDVDPGPPALGRRSKADRDGYEAAMCGGVRCGDGPDTTGVVESHT
jgi:hypothetical protein